MPKQTLRQQLLARRRALNRSTWLENSRLAQERILDLKEYKQAGCIALYSPISNEIDTTAILQAVFSAGKRALYPVVLEKEMTLRQIDHLEQLREGRFGIFEPGNVGHDHQAEEVDLMVIPGVGFDRTGHRIGFGKGYYDRFLCHPAQRPALVGLCHDFQLISGDLPADRHDIRMDIIVTEQRVIYCGSNRSHPGDPDSHRGG